MTTIKFAKGMWFQIFNDLKPSLRESQNQNQFGKSVLITNDGDNLIFRANNYITESKIVIEAGRGITFDGPVNTVVDMFAFKSVSGKSEVALEIHDTTITIDSGKRHFEFPTLDPNAFHPELDLSELQYRIIGDREWLIEAFRQAQSSVNFTSDADITRSYSIRDNMILTTDSQIGAVVTCEPIGTSTPDVLDLNPILSVVSSMRDGEVFLHLSDEKCSIMVSKEYDCYYTFTPIEGEFPKIDGVINNLERQPPAYKLTLTKSNLKELISNIQPIIAKGKQADYDGGFLLINKDGKLNVIINIRNVLRYEESVEAECSDIDFSFRLDVKDILRISNVLIGDAELSVYEDNYMVVIRDLGNVNVKFVEIIIEET